MGVAKNWPRGTERTAEDGGQVSVENTGRGLPDAAQERVFEPFYTTKPSGMGMGLLIARSIVQAHKGSISARNNAAGGATFVVALPGSAGTPI